MLRGPWCLRPGPPPPRHAGRCRAGMGAWGCGELGRLPGPPPPDIMNAAAFFPWRACVTCGTLSQLCLCTGPSMTVDAGSLRSSVPPPCPGLTHNHTTSCAHLPRKLFRLLGNCWNTVKKGKPKSKTESCRGKGRTLRKTEKEGGSKHALIAKSPRSAHPLDFPPLLLWFGLGGGGARRLSAI